MIKFGIDKLDKIVSPDKRVYVLQKGRRGTGYAGFEMRFCEYRLLKNLLENDEPCGVIHMAYGDTFGNMYRHHDGWKVEYNNPDINTEEFNKFDEETSIHISKYSLYEFKIYNNAKNTIVEYINNFLVGKVKYIFITNMDIYNDEDGSILKTIYDIADKSGIVFVIRSSYNIKYFDKKDIIEFNKDKDTGEVTVTIADANGNEVTSEPMIHHKNDGMGYIE